MDKTKVKDWAPILAVVIRGLSVRDAEDMLVKCGLSNSEACDIVFSLLDSGMVVGTIDDVSATIVNVVEFTLRLLKDKEKTFDEHCKCKSLDVNGKCTAFCYRNRLKSPGVMIDCIGIESSPVINSGQLIGSRRF